MSDQPFFVPSDPRATGPLRSPGPDENLQRDQPKEKKNKGPGKKSKKVKPVSSVSSTNPLVVPENNSQTGAVIISQPAVPDKVDRPGPDTILSLGQDSSTSSNILPASNSKPTATTTGACPGQLPDSDVESLSGGRIKIQKKEKSQILKQLSRMR